MAETHEIYFDMIASKDIQALFGPNDVNIKTLENVLDVDIVTRGEKIVVSGSHEKAQTVESV